MSCLNISIRPKGTLQSEEKESLSIQASPQHSHQMQKARTISNVKQSHSREASSHLLAEHGQVGLADDKGEEEVDANSDGLPSSSGLNVVELRGHKPPQGAPGPGKPSSEQALKRQNGGGGILGDVAGDLVEAAAHDAGHNHKADEHLNANPQRIAPCVQACRTRRKDTSADILHARGHAGKRQHLSTGRQCSRQSLSSNQCPSVAHR